MLETRKFNIIKSFLYVLKKILKKITTQLLNSKHECNFITNASSFNCKVERFWNITANISIDLVYINILPIPLLDGGNVLLLLIEITTTNNSTFLEKTVFIIFTILANTKIVF